MYFTNNFSLLPLVVSKNELGYKIKAVIPAVNKEDIDIVYQDGVLTIGAEIDLVGDDKDLVYSEVKSKKYSRSIDLPNFDYDTAVAKYENGVLTIDVPQKTVKLIID